jgi:hypothetical protein
MNGDQSFGKTTKTAFGLAIASLNEQKRQMKLTIGPKDSKRTCSGTNTS